MPLCFGRKVRANDYRHRQCSCEGFQHHGELWNEDRARLPRKCTLGEGGGGDVFHDVESFKGCVC